jgi:hypothetical protein
MAGDTCTMYRLGILIKNIQKMHISPKFIIVFLFILPKLALADSVLDDASSDIVAFNALTLPDPPRVSKVLQPYASLQLVKDAMLGSGIRPISAVYSDANSFADSGSVVLSAGGNLDVSVATEPLLLRLNTPIVLSSSANIVSFAQFSSLSISEGSSLTLGTGNTSFLARVTNQSQPVLIGNSRTSLGGTLVLSNAGGGIVTMGTSGVTVNPVILASVPEPSNLSMLVMGLLGIGLVARRKTNKH